MAAELLVRALVVALAGFAPQGKVVHPGPDSGCAWGRDVNPGGGEKLAAAVHGELLAIVRTAPKERPAKAAELARKRANAAIEAWKRFRNPELRDLARACLDDPDWHVVHRGLHWLRALRDPELAREAWPLLEHPEPRLREKAALSCLESWDDAAAASLAGGHAKEALLERGARESDPYVKEALAALLRRMSGRLHPCDVAPEIALPAGDGLTWTPFLRGMSRLAQVAPGVQPVESGEPVFSAAELPASSKWTAPLLAFGKEEVPGIHLQPFANLRKNDSLVHTGQDVGGCLDGAGLYAIGDGVVRYVATGSDCGTLIVVEHRCVAANAAADAAPAQFTAVYMHAGGTVYVAAGDAVSCGQLLGTMGLSFSIENGGQFAHLHFGLYRGPFRVGHNYGYQPAAQELGSWLDPADALPKLLRGEAPFETK
jgi:hypothetical protein